ncbi:MAG TPA: hypothetical protein ENK26_14765 [Gammaproteobacteria bacterium]|nr:hypothetical protein [Gammaproteobacteria bacterium]
MKWLRELPVLPLAVVAILMAIAPIQPKPHLVEKLTMLMNGELVRPLDIFDLFLHGAPIALLIIKLFFLKNAMTR